MALLAVVTALVAGHHQGCNTDACERRVAHRKTLRRWRRETRPWRGWLTRVAWCESTNRPWAIDPTGTYFGLYQFDLATWWSVGGRGYPHQAARLEQDHRAVVLRLRRGTAPWPVCG
jgi:Transglycosylase-like domain